MELLKSIYTSPDSPGGFSSAAALLREARKQDPTINRKQVADFLESQRTYTLFKGRRVIYPRLKTIPICWMSDVQCDLASFEFLAKYNGGHRFLLLGVDVLSRRMFGAAIKNKAAAEMKRGFEELFRQMPKSVMRIYTDRGKEFTSREIKNFFEEKEIEKIETHGGDTKASVCERANRTVKGRIYKYFSEYNTHNWVDVLPKILHGINTNVCRVTGMRPVDINDNNWKPLWDRLYGPSFEDYAKPKTRFHKGDFVRIDKYQGSFGRGFHTQFTDEIFTVDKVQPGGPHRPTVYRLVDRKNSPIKGVFYDENLSKTKGYGETTHRIAKVHRTRKRGNRVELLVSWVGHPPDERSWIRKSDLVA